MGNEKNKNSSVVSRRQTKKVVAKLKTLNKKGKLKRHVMDSYRQINNNKYAASRKRTAHIEEDWRDDRELKEANDQDDDILPLDMLDADINWEKSAFAGKLARVNRAESDEDDDGEIELKKRKFAGDLEEGVQEMLPIKVCGKLVRQTRKISDASISEETTQEESTNKEVWQEEDLSALSAAQLLTKRKHLMEGMKHDISACAFSLLSDPQQQVHNLRTLFGLCKGEKVHSIMRESTQKLAIASTCEVLVDVIPGYPIREQTEDELSQKQKKETRKLYDFESSLLRNYTKYLELLEKNVQKLLPNKNVQLDETTFTFALAIVSLRSLCKLLIAAPHFNFATNIITLLVRLATSTHNMVVEQCCEALSTLFAADVALKHCAFGARAIATIVNQKKCDVSPKLISTFLTMNIREVDRGERGKEKQRLQGKRFKLAKERQSKTKNKYAKQLKKLEADLKEAEAAESLSSKLKNATEAMKHVFVTYFRVIKHMSTSVLLEPVLEGLSKFAHLLNIEFFDDIISALETLVEQQHIRLLDSMHCIHTVFVVLSGEGVAINVDPFGFYRSMYRVMSSVPFEKRKDVVDRVVMVMIRTLNIMVVVRRKKVSLCRVAAFTKRLLDIGLLLPTNCLIAILALVRTFFIAHPRLTVMLEDGDEMANGLFSPDTDDPDCCNALSSTLIPETAVLSKYPNEVVVQFARHLMAKVPSSGVGRLSPHISTVKPEQWIGRCREEGSDAQSEYHKEILAFCKKRKTQLTSKNLQAVIGVWLQSKM